MTVEKPLISVLIPTYNVELYVEEAVRSIINQTYKNLEIIVVDDHSTDNTYNILLKLSLEDKRVRLFRNEKNLRIAKTLNFAFQQSTGGYIARMDGDDVSLPDRIEKQLAFLNSDKNLDLVGLHLLMIDDFGKEIHVEKYMSNADKINEVAKYTNPVPHFWIAKRKVYDEVGPYRIPPAEDYDFLLRAIEKGFRLSNLPEVKYLWRMRLGNSATAAGLIQRKTVRYVKKLHKERVSNAMEIDSFTQENLLNFIKSSAMEKYLFNISSQFHFRYLNKKRTNKPLAVFFMFVSVLFSPKYKLDEIYNRYKTKKLIDRFCQS
jgi:glycosyltransferase involved in cell wall biosynthesis